MHIVYFVLQPLIHFLFDGQSVTILDKSPTLLKSQYNRQHELQHANLIMSLWPKYSSGITVNTTMDWEAVWIQFIAAFSVQTGIQIFRYVLSSAQATDFLHASSSWILYLFELLFHKLFLMNARTHNRQTLMQVPIDSITFFNQLIVTLENPLL